MNHPELVSCAEKWLRKSQGCSVVITELTASTSTGEQPDAIGFRAWGRSILIECKTSRQDFMADARKNFRINPSAGMGDFRFYLCEAGVLDVGDMPDGWGLLVVDGGKIRRKCGVNPRKINAVAPFDGHKRNEIVMCVSALRRVGHKAVSAACHPTQEPA